MESGHPSKAFQSAQPPYSWFTEVWNQFVESVNKQRFGHAVLLIGSSGIGTLDLARSMALYLLCAAPQNGRSCGACKSCLLNQSDGHPDLTIVSPEEKSTAIKIDQIRSVSDSVGKTAQQGGNKVIVVYPSESMNLNAANALLKNLEEPSGHTHFILVCERPSDLLATIKSRCIIWSLPLPSRQAAEKWLAMNKVEDAERGLELLGNNPLEIRRWVDHDLFAQRAKLESTLEEVISGAESIPKASQKILSMGCEWIIEQIQHWIHIAVKSQLASYKAGNGALDQRLAAVSAKRLLSWESTLGQRRAMLTSGANPNPELLLNELLMELLDLTRSRH